MSIKTDTHIIVHYAEIGLKGRNRPFFENTLIINIKEKLAEFKVREIKNIYGRILITVGSIEKDIIKNILSNIPGIKYFAFTEVGVNDMDEIKNIAVDLLKKVEFNTFRVSAKRASKEFNLTSQQINAQVGEQILNNIPGKKVNLESPEITLYVELINQYAFIYCEKISSIGGLPVGSSGRVLSLLSAGIDSPVASFRMMKRGAKVLFIHFHSYPQTSKESIKNVEDIVKKLNRFQGKSKLYLIPFLEFQKEVVEKGDTRDRVILYRRMMIRVAEMVASIEKINTLVTGESLGQVASQTMQNMRVINEVCTNTQVLKPLICYDKEEIITEAQRIGTYDVSSRNQEDCCSLFIPNNPNTRADLSEIKKQEKNINIKKHLLAIKNSLEIKK